jgi:hypothetical protein
VSYESSRSEALFVLIEEWLDRIRARKRFAIELAEADEWRDLAARAKEPINRFRCGMRARWSLEIAAARADHYSAEDAALLRDAGKMLEVAAHLDLDRRSGD